MSKVDAKGRIVLPQDLRERLGLDPGTEVEVHEKDGRAVVEPEESASDIIADLEDRIEDAASNRDRPHEEELTGEARDHVETVRRQARETNPDCDKSATDE
jgi:AbrB family looped-hinge helix DNA binding protein